MTEYPRTVDNKGSSFLVSVGTDKKLLAVMTMVSSFVTMASLFPLLIFKVFDVQRLGRDWFPVADICGQKDIKDEGPSESFVKDVVRWTGRGCNTLTEIPERSMGSPETMIPGQCLDLRSTIERWE
jgi:hypothetical protein